MMASIINESTSYNIKNQVASGSRSSLLMSHIDFKRSEDDDNNMMSTKCLQNKYQILMPDHKMSCNLNETLKINGQIKNNNNNNANKIINGTINEVNDGIPTPKIVLFPREKIQLEWKQPHKVGAGLANLGNTCFMNSVLQCLTYCPPLVNYLLYSDEDHMSRCNVVGFCMTCELVKHIKRTYSHSGDAIKPIYICQRLKSIAKHFTFGRQEDAHEFLRYVIDNMWRSCLSNYELNSNFKLDAASKETTVINQIFGGYHRSQVICLQCKEKSNTYDYFMDFMLDIKNVVSLDKALEKFVQPEILQNENAYKCPRCKRKVFAKKQFTVFKAPNVATFQFKRFDYNRMFGGKITKVISYPEKLNLRPFMSDSKGPPILYKLNSVLVHLGPTCNSGHYFCYIRNSNNCWYLMDDSRVTQVGLGQVLNQQAYILFYVRIDTDFHKPNPVKNCVPLQPPTVKSNCISSPEIPYIHKKCNSSYGLQNGNFHQIQSAEKLSNQTSNFNMVSFDLIKRPNVALEKNKPRNSESASNKIKCLVPYQSDSSDDENDKQDSTPNRNFIGCDKEFSTSVEKKPDILATHADGTTDHISPKITPPETNDGQQEINTCTPALNAIIPYSRVGAVVGGSSNHQTINLSETNNQMILAPITLKVKATTSSWHIVETSLKRSPSVASGSSTNSVNSTTEWSVTECNFECNSNQHSKHHHHKHRNKHARCPSILKANGSVTQLLSTNSKLPQSNMDSDEKSDAKMNSLDTKASPEHFNGSFDFETESRLNQRTETDSEAAGRKYQVSSDDVGFQINDDNHSPNGFDARERLDRKCIVSHRNSNDSSHHSRESSHHSRESSHHSRESSHHSRESSLHSRESSHHSRKSSHHSRESSHHSRESSNHSRESKEDSKYKDKNHIDQNEMAFDDEVDNNNHRNRIKLKKKKKHKRVHMRQYQSDSSDERSSLNEYKLKKKRKKKHKKRKYTESSSSGSESNASNDNQLQWIERTKETVEQERKVPNSDSNTKQWDENVRDLAHTNQKRISVDKNNTSINNNKSNEALDHLLKNPLTGGYGESVNTWDGGKSQLSVSSENQKRHWTENDDDHYNNEYDSGKTKKVKHHKNEHYSYETYTNPFQNVANSQSFKHRNGMFKSSHRSKHWHERHSHNNNYYNNDRKSWKHHHNNNHRYKYNNTRR